MYDKFFYKPLYTQVYVILCFKYTKKDIVFLNEGNLNFMEYDGKEETIYQIIKSILFIRDMTEVQFFGKMHLNVVFYSPNNMK